MNKILIVDDDKDIRDITQKRLRQANYEVITASTGQEALDICSSIHPDLVLLDIAIPQMDGYQTCKKIKQESQTKDISVLFVTGKGLLPEGIDKHCQDLGACGYISKPFAIEELLNRITEILGQ
jgi:DNA-binding response OmpR family regulator